MTDKSEKGAHPGPGVVGEAVAEGADDGVEPGGGAEDEAGVGALQHEVAPRDEHLPRRRRHPAPTRHARRSDRSPERDRCGI